MLEHPLGLLFAVNEEPACAIAGKLVASGLPFAELKTRSLIDTRARAANDSPDFSKLIREDLPEEFPSDASGR